MILREYRLTDKFALFEANSLQNGRDEFSKWNEDVRAGGGCWGIDRWFGDVANGGWGDGFVKGMNWAIIPTESSSLMMKASMLV